jgi:hypothetical protein
MHLNETVGFEPLLCQEVAHAGGRLVVRTKHQPLVRGGRLQADAPQGVEIAFDGVTRRGARQPVVVGERRAP